ncbi:MAG: hypothetical protein ACJ763_01740 [Bdellovibrionia bacterium]
MSKVSKGILSGENKSAGFTSLIVLAGLSVAAGSMLYSSTTRSRNMNNMLQNDRVRNSRDAIANSLRASVSIPSVLLKSAETDPSSQLLGCIDASNTTPCNTVDASGNNKHDLKIFDTRGNQISGTAANPVSYDALTGSLCDASSSATCQIQATTWFTISCGGATDCKGKPSAIVSIGFLVEQKPGIDLPNKIALKPIESVPLLTVPLSAIQTGVSQQSASPGDPNDPYNPIVDPTTAGDITVFDPSTGSKLCNSMKALGNPAIAYDTIPTLGTCAVQYTNITHDLHAADENISDISNITGNTWATASNISSVSNVTAPCAGVSLNAKTIGCVSNITSPHTYIVAHTVSDVSNVTGYLYANADSVSQFSNITNTATSDYFIAVHRGWITSGATAPTAVSFSNITSGRFMLCGFNVNDISNVTASFVGLQNASILNSGSNFNIGQLTIYGGTIANLSNFTGNLTLYNTTVGTLTNVTGSVKAYGGSISQINTMTGSVDLYNGATLGSYSGVAGGVTTH